MENQTIEEIYEGARLAAVWWADSLRPSMAKLFWNREASACTHEEKEVFRHTLELILSRELTTKEVVYLRVDYQPDKYLSAALRTANITYGLGTLPMKSEIVVKRDTFYRFR